MATLLRLAHNHKFSEGSIWLCAVLGLLLFSACSRPDRQQVDRLNSLSYACHYRQIDSTLSLAQRAYDASQGYPSGRAEALNNMAFVHIVRMEYDKAQACLDEVPALTDNQLELLVAYVQQMRLCQRRSRNKDFYDYRERAITCLKRIGEEQPMLTERQQKRLLYAKTEYAIVNSTYFYYVGLERQSVEALRTIEPNEVQRDTAQFLNYLYNIGAGGIIIQGTQRDVNQQEFDHLMRCYLLAREGGYPYFEANALEALSEHLMDPDSRQQLMTDNLPAMKFINPEAVANEMLSGWLAERALDIFCSYGDIYQIAGAYRTLASCFRLIGDDESALYYLHQALADSAISQAPDLVASIREQLSVVYSSMDDKRQSDENRNIYIDLMTDTRQDRSLEARASQYDATARQLNLMLAAVGMAIVLLVFSLWLFNYLNKRQKLDNHLDDLIEQRQDDLAVSRLRLENDERRHLEQRAKISLVNSITPFIDRIIHAISRLENERERKAAESEMDYVCELIGQINAYNEILTHWIQLRQGELTLKIESFPLQQLFDLMTKSRRAFEMKGVSLDVKPTEAQVKGDRVLTLFMLNTLADNARKFTAEGGCVTIAATETDRYVEIAVSDTGRGMTAEQVAHVFDAKPIRDDNAKPSSLTTQSSHGFGLLNCKGIIEKYRKISQIFSVCQITAESEPGKGSRFAFRLPKGIVRLLLALLTIHYSPAAVAQPVDDLGRASIFADSAYFSNINGSYEKTLLFADSCRHYLNRHYRHLRPHGRQLMQAFDNTSAEAPEITWLHDSLPVNYGIVIDIRNESAVAALALHEWQLYNYNNRIYTQLYKELSADSTLPDYCRAMQQSQTNKRIAVILLVLVLFSILPAYYLLYYRHRLYQRFYVEREQKTSLELMEDELRRTELESANLHVANAVLDNCLSTLKHETMYYPSRIRQLLELGDMASLREVAAYYRELYGILSLQAMSQVERIHLHVRPLDNGILGDAHLVSYLFDILRKQGGGEKTLFRKDDKYIEASVTMPRLHLTADAAQQLFTPDIGHIPYLLCRQIVRDHGEATNRRLCGIWADVDNNGQTIVHVILPAAKKVNNK